MDFNISRVKYIADDFKWFQTLVFDEEIMQYITGEILTPDQALEKFNAMVAINKEEEELGYFKLIGYNTEFIGECKLERYAQDKSMLELGYILKKAYRRKGIGTLICQELLSIAAEHYPNMPIIAIIDPDNLASRSLLEKFNFKSFFVGVEDNLPTEKFILTQ